MYFYRNLFHVYIFRIFGGKDGIGRGGIRSAVYRRQEDQEGKGIDFSASRV